MTLPTSLDLYTSEILAGILFDPRQTISTSHWRTFYQSRTITSDQEYIRFDRIQASRRIAPFMLPNMPGRPIFRTDGAEIEFFKPAYTKPKDTISPGEFMHQSPSETARQIALRTPAQRMAERMTAIMKFHRESIERLWDWMYATSLVSSKVTVNMLTDDGLTGPSYIIDYKRDVTHDVTQEDQNIGGILVPASIDWGDDMAKIFPDIQRRVDQVGNADFGGVVTDLLLGAKAAAVFTEYFDTAGKGLSKLDRNYAGAESVLVNRGIIRTNPLNPFTYLGQLDANLAVWKVSGPGNKFQNDDGSFTEIINEWDAIYVSPSLEMIMAFGAIIDVDNLQATPIYPKQWVQQDPSARFIMSQSAPLAIPTNPNATMRVRVGKN